MLLPTRLLTALLAVLLVSCASPAPPTSPSFVGASSQAPGSPLGIAAPSSATVSASLAPSTSPAPSVAPAGGSLDPALAAQLQAVLDRTRSRVHVPGLSAAILLADGRFWSGTSGERQTSPARPVDARTVFAIASITKTFVTATVMQLVHEGSLRLTDRLNRWVPSVPNARRITVAQLLSHTSGVFNYFEHPNYNALVFQRPNRRWTFDQIMALVKGPYCAPGTCYHYSNTNFVLLGRIVELVTADALASQIEKRFTGPMGLQETGLQTDFSTPADRAHGYTGTTDWTGQSPVIPTISSATVAGAAGAMVSTPSDLARWAAALYTGALVPQPELDQMLSFQKCRDNYGLGTRKVIINGRVAYGHLGSLVGYMDAMWYMPAEGATVVLLSNLGGWNLDAAMRRLQSVLFAGIAAPPPAYDPSMNTRHHDGVTLHC